MKDMDDIIWKVFQVLMTISLTIFSFTCGMLFNQETNNLLRIVLLLWVGMMYLGLLFILWTK
jgi:hypothetical protein